MVTTGRGCDEHWRRQDGAGREHDTGAQNSAPADDSNWIHHPLPPHLIPAIDSLFMGREARARRPRSIRDLKLLNFPAPRDWQLMASTHPGAGRSRRMGSFEQLLCRAGWETFRLAGC
jgi:hypothetical protein